MTQQAIPRKLHYSARQNILPARNILGRRTTAVLLKRRLNKTGHPYNRMFLMFDDGGGMEFFFPGLLLPDEFMDAAALAHKVRQRRRRQDSRVAFRARLDAVDRSRSATRRSFSHGAKTGADGTEDKSIIRAILGRRIEVIYYCINIGKNRPMGHLGFAFSDGTAFEFIVFGRTYACNKMESFDLSSTIHRGNGIYENELLAFQDPDSDGIAMPINRPHQWSDLDT